MRTGGSFRWGTLAGRRGRRAPRSSCRSSVPKHSRTSFLAQHRVPSFFLLFKCPAARMRGDVGHAEAGFKATATDGSATEVHPHVLRALEEVKRVLKPGGVFLCNTSLPDQCRDGFWWCAIIKEAAEVLASTRYPSEEWFGRELKGLGFRAGGSSSSEGENGAGAGAVFHTLLDETLQCKEQYEDLEGPLKEEWRNTVSTWSLAGSADEEGSILQTGLHWYRTEVWEKGEEARRAYFEKREALRAKIGQTTHVEAWKPSA